jgi:hypothetical protein
MKMSKKATTGTTGATIKIPPALQFTPSRIRNTDDMPPEQEPEPANPSAMDTQVGGDHYKTLKIQPMQYSMENNFNACQHTAIKYITRYKTKGGRLDLEKAIHALQMLIEMEYPCK